uniref:EF-hand domain-containing protein n=1 Tax=Sexangularia sp. CB-2014 TaxID=1486929 RepID=A0A7S1Y8I4_9EUKA
MSDSFYAKKSGLSLEQIQQARAHFAKYDGDGNGLLDRDEVTQLFSTIFGEGANPSRGAKAMAIFVETTFSSYDTDGNGVIDWDEFLVMYARAGLLEAPLANDADLRRAFTAALEPGKETCNAAGLARALRSLGLAPTASELSSAMAKRGTATLDYAAFEALYRGHHFSSPQEHRAALTAAFHRLDTLGSGTIDEATLRSALLSLGGLSNAEIDRILDEAGAKAAQGGRIEYDRLVQLLTSD